MARVRSLHIVCIEAEKGNLHISAMRSSTKWPVQSKANCHIILLLNFAAEMKLPTPPWWNESANCHRLLPTFAADVYTSLKKGSTLAPKYVELHLGCWFFCNTEQLWIQSTMQKSYSHRTEWVYSRFNTLCHVETDSLFCNEISSPSSVCIQMIKAILNGSWVQTWKLAFSASI